MDLTTTGDGARVPGSTANVLGADGMRSSIAGGFELHARRPAVNDPRTRSSSLLKVVATVIALVLAVAIAVAIVLLAYAPPLPGASDLSRELHDRGRLVVVGDPQLLRLPAEGAQLIAAEQIRDLPAALDGEDEDRLDAILHREGIAGIVAGGRAAGDEPRTLRDRLSAFDHFEVLQGVYLTPVASLYLRRRGLRVGAEEGAILARAARQILAGSTLPRAYAFPEALRRTRNVEVLVMLREGESPRLWRSARGGSIARALITAATVARDRWMERETALGGPLDQRLPSMTVEVYLLEEDGTLADRSAAFVERVITPEHGVALEEQGRERGSWHYLLPEATRERGRGSAMRAYAALLEEAGLPGDAFVTRDLRLYRLVARPVGTSAPGSASVGSRSARSPARSPASLIDPLGVPELDTRL